MDNISKLRKLNLGLENGKKIIYPQSTHYNMVEGLKEDSKVEFPDLVWLSEGHVTLSQYKPYSQSPRLIITIVYHRFYFFNVVFNTKLN